MVPSFFMEIFEMKAKKEKPHTEASKPLVYIIND